MGRGPIPSRRSFTLREMPRSGAIRYQPRFRGVVPEEGAGCPRVTQPFAARVPSEEGVPLDLHVLGAPPAFILSQDRTLRSKAGGRPPAPTGRPPGSAYAFGKSLDPSERNALAKRCPGKVRARKGFRPKLRCPSFPLARPPRLSPRRPPISGSQGAPRGPRGRAAGRYIASRPRGAQGGGRGFTGSSHLGEGRGRKSPAISRSQNPTCYPLALYAAQAMLWKRT